MKNIRKNVEEKRVIFRRLECQHRKILQLLWKKVICCFFSNSLTQVKKEGLRKTKIFFILFFCLCFLFSFICVLLSENVYEKSETIATVFTVSRLLPPVSFVIFSTHFSFFSNQFHVTMCYGQ